jgi:hypothetical protein
VFGIVVGRVNGDFLGKTSGRVGIWRAGDAESVKLTPAGGDVDQFGFAEAVESLIGGGVKLGAVEPESLR